MYKGYVHTGKVEVCKGACGIYGSVCGHVWAVAARMYIYIYIYMFSPSEGNEMSKSPPAARSH